MTQFRFKLEPVLKQRKAVEDTCQRDLAKGLRQRMILHGQLRQMQTTITDSKRSLGDGLVGRVDMDRVSQFARFSGQAAVRAQQIVSKLVAVERQVEAARHRLAQAMRARKAIERLRERQWTQWKQVQDRREAAQLDEIGVGQYAYRLVMEAEK